MGIGMVGLDVMRLPNRYRGWGYYTRGYETIILLKIEKMGGSGSSAP